MNNTETFYIYVGHSDPPHSTWKFIPDTPEERQRAIDDGYTAVSIISFAYEPEKGKAEPVRRGSLFLDFDSKHDPAIAVDMAKMFIERLAERYGVDPECLHYWMSGGKGCHIEIPAAIYGGEAGHPDLPLIQRDILFFLGRYDFHYPKICEVLDFQLYCQGKGKLLRLPNIKRHDGRYKVPVSAWEFFKLDYPALERLTLAPRKNFDPGTNEPVQSPRLAEFYNIAVGWRRRDSNSFRPISGLEALFDCAFMSHCYENQGTLPEPQWWAMISILATFGDLGRQTAHLFSRDYPGYNFEETERKIKRQLNALHSQSCAHIRSLGFDCGKSCGVHSPADLWKYRRSEEARLAMNFVLKEDGVYRQSENGNSEAIKICSPMKVLGKMRNPEGAGWARLVEIATPDGGRKEVCVFMRDMKGRGDNLIGELQDHGLEPCHGQKIAHYLMEYIMNSAPRDLLLLCVQQIGWLGDTYVLPDAVFGSDLKEKIHFQAEGADNLHQVAGSLGEWQEQVGGYCRGNSLLELLVSYALTGPLLKLVGLEGGGLHVYGSSSSGKTTAAIVAGSVCGGGGQRGFLRQWRATHNALESVATLHNDNLLILDEISQANPDTVSQVAYMLANGQGKDRLRNDASRRKTYRWLLNFLSTGEQTINDKIQEFGKYTALAGQEVRVIDLPIDGLDDGKTFQNLYDLPDSGKFSELLSRNARQYYGSPLRAFLEKLCANVDEHRAQVERGIEAFVREFCPPEASGQVRRVASKFGLIAAAGELGIAFGVLPFDVGASKKAAAGWFDVWLSRRNGLGNLEMIKAIERIKEYLARCSDTSRFINLDSPSPYPPHQLEGYVWCQNGKKYVMVLTPFFNDLAKGVNRQALITELDKLGYLAHTKEGTLMETKSVHGESKRGAVFIPSTWEGEPTQEELEEEARIAKANLEELFPD